MPFVKLDCGILNSTVWVDSVLRDVFLTALLMAEPYVCDNPLPQLDVRTMEPTGWSVPPGWYGWVAAAGVGILTRALVEDREAGIEALVRLGQPELDSRSQDFEGRRLVRVDGGYIALNYDKYRNRDETGAERQRRYRLRKLDSSRVTPSPSRVTVTQAEAEAEVQEQEKDTERASGQTPSNGLSKVSTQAEACTVRTSTDVRTESEAGTDVQPPPVVQPPKIPAPAKLQTIVQPRRKDAAWEGPRVYVPQRIHTDFIALRNSPNAEQELLAWYATVSEEWTNGARASESPGSEMFRFWRDRYDEQWPTTKPKKRDALDDWRPTTNGIPT
jgi:hypothetical protein